jgi:hypothetical protein
MSSPFYAAEAKVLDATTVLDANLITDFLQPATAKLVKCDSKVEQKKTVFRVKR